MSRGWQWQRARLARSLAIGAALAVLGTASAHAADPIKIGHVAALSGASAQSGEAITRGLTIAIDEINAKGGLLGGRKLELVQRDDESEPAQGRDRRARADLQGKGRGALRRHRYAGGAGDRAGGQQGEDAVHGRVGRGHRHHPQRRQPQLRVPRLGRRRAGRRQAARLRQQEIRREEARADADQQSLGRVQREGPQSAADKANARSRSPASRSSRTTTSTWCRSSRGSRRRAPTPSSSSSTRRPARR